LSPIFVESLYLESFTRLTGASGSKAKRIETWFDGVEKPIEFLDSTLNLYVKPGVRATAVM